MTYPAPLVAADVDLSDFQYMELDVQRLRDSRFAAKVRPDAFRAGVLLWCAAWHQVPAGSLPDDDDELAKLSGYGYVVKEWRKVREQALMLFVKCSDGRLYHSVIAEKANAAWESKLHYQHGKLVDRLRKENKKRADDKLAPLPLPTFESWNSERLAARIPAEAGARSAGIPLEKTLRGNGEGTESKEPSEADASGADAPAGPKAPTIPDPPPAPPPPPPPAPPPPAPLPPDPADVIFGLGVPLLTAAGVTDRNARSMLGLFRKQHSDVAVVEALQRCAQERPIQPVPWLQAVLRADPAKGRASKTFRERDADAAADDWTRWTGGMAAKPAGEVVEMEASNGARIAND